jgi:hypothetical protein
MLTHSRHPTDLAWFFSVGLSSFERSTFGPMLQRAEMFGSVAKRQRKPLTARVRSGGGSGGEPSYEPDERTLIRFGDVSRRLGRVAPRLVEVLALYYGDVGESWARHPRGRWVALFPLTQAGLALMDLARESGNPELSEADRLRVEVELDFVKGKNATKRALIFEALKQAAALQREADEAWERTARDITPDEYTARQYEADLRKVSTAEHLSASDRAWARAMLRAWSTETMHPRKKAA